MSLSLIFLLVKLIFLAPQIWDLGKKLLELIRLIRDPVKKMEYRERLRVSLENHFNRKSSVQQCSDEIGALEAEIRIELAGQK